MTEWLADFQYVLFAQSLGLPQAEPITKVVWHCTVGWCAEHAFNVYRDAEFGACPHITAEYAGTGGHGTTRTITKRKFQHVPLTWASYALQRGNRANPCRVETNRAGVIQIERVGFPTDVVTDHEHRWWGEAVLAPILRACPLIPPSVVQGLGRMTEDEWSAWPGGQARHANVCCQPDGHYDPPELDLDLILHYALDLIDHDTKDDTMPDYILRNAADLNDPWLAVYPDGKLRHIGGTEAGCLINGAYDDGRPFPPAAGKTLSLVDERDINAYHRARTQAGA